MLHIVYSVVDHEMNADKFETYLKKVPESHRQLILAYKKWQDRHRCLIGKILLLHCFDKFGLGNRKIYEISYTPLGRPFLSNRIDFNISHSGQCVVCVMSNESKVGIDIEEIIPFSLEDVEIFFSDEEQGVFKQSAEALQTFYNLWTKKEAIMKACEIDLDTALKSVKIRNNDTALVGNEIWYLNELNLVEGHICHLATNRKISKISPNVIII